MARRKRVQVKGYTVMPDGRLRAHVKVRGAAGSGQRVKAFPADTHPQEIAVWREQARLELMTQKVVKGTLKADVGEYLKLASGLTSIVDREREVKSWLPRFGARPRSDITPQDIQQQLNDWVAEDRWEPSTLNNRLNALSALYRVLGGRSGYNPCRDVKRLRVPDAQDRGLPLAEAERIVGMMTDDTASRVRAEVLLFTGMRSGELKLLKRGDVQLDIEKPLVAITTLKGGQNRRVPLTPKAVAALRAFDAAGLWGKAFSNGSLRKSLRLACEKAGHAPIRVHDLRHTFASWLVNDLRVPVKTAMKMLGHRNIQTTLRYLRHDEDLVWGAFGQHFGLDTVEVENGTNDALATEEVT